MPSRHTLHKLTNRLADSSGRDRAPSLQMRSVLRVFRFTLAMVVGSFFMASCATRPPTAFEPPPTAPCCRNWQEVHFEKMSGGGVSHAHISLAKSPTFDFPEGRSTFVAYALPQGQAHTVEVDAYVSSDWLPVATIFRPRLLYLDSNLKVVGRDGMSRMQQDGKFLAGPYYFAVSAVPADARFLVVYAGPSAHTPRLVAHSHNGDLYGLPNAYEGEISVIVK